MQRIFNIITIIFFAAAIFLSCEKNESYSEIPAIEFQNYRVYDTSYAIGFYQRNVAVSFKFVDGDGDIGFREGVDDSTTKYNLFFSRYEQRNGQLINVDSLLVDSIKYSIPYRDVMSREGQNKTIKGRINVDIGEIVTYDTIKYDFYILDRAGHKSNISSTTEITGLKKP